MEPPRWHFRLDNFRSALALLREATAALEAGLLSELEREGLIQRFQYTWELGWKTLRDYLFETGVDISATVPANVIRAAFQAGLIRDGDAWMETRRARNQMAHEYDREAFEKIVGDIKDRYLALLIDLETRLEHERDIGN